MNWRAFRVRLQAEHHQSSQKVAEIELACHQAENALQLFARLGHQFHLAPGPEPEADGWPKILFHVDSAPNGRLVRNEYEAEELGDGWFDNLNDAQHNYGMKTQFAGRGGVGLRSLPVASGPATEATSMAEQMIREFREGQRERRANAEQEQSPAQPDGDGSPRSKGGEESGDSAERGEGLRQSRPGKELEEAPDESQDE